MCRTGQKGVNSLTAALRIRTNSNCELQTIQIQTSASVELTQTRQLFHGAHISRGFYRESQKATYAACKPLFLAVAEI